MKVDDAPKGAADAGTSQPKYSEPYNSNESCFRTVCMCGREFRCKFRCGIATVDGYVMFWRCHHYGTILFVFSLLAIHAPLPRFHLAMLFPAMAALANYYLSRTTQLKYGLLYEAEYLNGDTLRLHFKVPAGWKWEAGQYAEILWKGERHPFTICSAPEEDTVSFCIKAVDAHDWCSALRYENFYTNFL